LDSLLYVQPVFAQQEKSFTLSNISLKLTCELGNERAFSCIKEEKGLLVIYVALIGAIKCNSVDGDIHGNEDSGCCRLSYDTVQSCRYAAYISTVASWYVLLPIYQTTRRHTLEEWKRGISYGLRAIQGEH
jgi:hypothetical protein